MLPTGKEGIFYAAALGTTPILSVSVDITNQKAVDRLLQNIRMFLKLDGKKVTVLTGKMEENLYLGSRNIKNIFVVPAQSASAYDLLDCQLILSDEASVKILNDQLSK